MVKVIRRTWQLPFAGILSGANVTDVGFADEVFLVHPQCHHSANDKVLVLRPIWKCNNGWVPKDTGFTSMCTRWDLRHVLDNIREPNVIGELVCRYGAFPQHLQVRIQYRP